MDLMSDSELEIVIASKGARRLEVIKAADKEYYLVVTLTTGVERGVRTKKGIRKTWASMDRLVERLQSYALSASVKLPPISLSLQPPTPALLSGTDADPLQ